MRDGAEAVVVEAPGRASALEQLVGIRRVEGEAVRRRSAATRRGCCRSTGANVDRARARVAPGHDDGTREARVEVGLQVVEHDRRVVGRRGPRTAWPGTRSGAPGRHDAVAGRRLDDVDPVGAARQRAFGGVSQRICRRSARRSAWRRRAPGCLDDRLGSVRVDPEDLDVVVVELAPCERVDDSARTPGRAGTAGSTSTRGRGRSTPAACAARYVRPLVDLDAVRADRQRLEHERRLGVAMPVVARRRPAPRSATSTRRTVGAGQRVAPSLSTTRTSRLPFWGMSGRVAELEHDAPEVDDLPGGDRHDLRAAARGRSGRTRRGTCRAAGR